VRLHPLLREYAGERYADLEPERQTAALAALLEAVADFAESHDAPTAADFAVLAREEALLADTMRRAASAHVAPQALIQAVRWLKDYIDLGGHWQLGTELRLLQLAARREVGDRAGEGTTLHNLGLLADNQGRSEEAARYYEQALVIRREVGDRLGEGTTLSNLGSLARSQGRSEEAARYYQQALGITREVGDRAGEGTTLWNIGYLEETLGRRDEAARAYRQALAIFEAIGAPDARRVREFLARLEKSTPSTASSAGGPASPTAGPMPMVDEALRAPDPEAPASPTGGEPQPAAVGQRKRRGWWPFGR
jgi:tetratricopeptide (TPR) repeat protein